MTLKQILSTVRVYTLPASAVPILVAAIAAWTVSPHFDFLIAALCLGVGLFAQMLSNVLNDYYDAKQGADQPDREGFVRPLMRGEVSHKSIRNLALILGIITAAMGIAIVWLTQRWWLLAVGAAILLGARAYTAGKNSWSYIGLGEVAAFLFFGWVAMLGTYYVQIGYLHTPIFLLATPFGLAIANIMVVNNYRDMDTDREVCKRTIAVRFGRPFCLSLFVVNGLLSIACLIPLCKHTAIMLALAALYLWFGWVVLFLPLKRGRGKELNPILGKTALNVVLLGVLATGILLVP